MNRKATPDILGTLMGGIKKENNKEIKNTKNKALKQGYFEEMKPIGAENIPELILKEKATFNLSKSVLADLEDCWIEIRKLRRDKKVSKTDIVEQAIEDTVKEFKLKKELSKLYEKLESNK